MEGLDTSARNTRQKVLILQCLTENRKEHITADEIESILKQNNTPVAKSTIYRYLSLLEDGGVVRKYLVSDNQSACYQFIGDKEGCKEHYHLICKECRQIVHFNNSVLSGIIGSINDTGDFVIDSERTVFYGKCGSCARGDFDVSKDFNQQQGRVDV